ncbi:MAG: NAD(P)-dependent oxidoreductase [Oceanicaulis sp.]|uniref:SDR family oxidoreductase n=1 Tax=Oceanicaulis sp. UBA2681 TaxID=1947007 RepID=UPI000C092A2C|nr:SDR family oxidoreductase [Oceanicaulis sp. UBA2681]MAP49032.1 NAD(P)-dependent oxidoreductase [Oceanicaulis sp.]HCR66078.1 NAD(P)-dependent oxidoreductase [Oceanicaulis sp.]
MGARSICLLGFGFTAKAVARRLSAEGWRISATTRSAEQAEQIRAQGYQPVRADPAKPDDHDALCAAVGACDAVLACAPPGEAGDPFLPALPAETLSGKWLGYLSTTGVYGDRQGGWAFEYEPVSPGQDRSIRRAQAEAQWLEHGARLFRLAGIYGPGRSAFDRLEADKVVFDVPGHVFSRIHADDIAQAIALSLEKPEAKGAFNLADDWPDTQPNVMTGAAQIAGVPGPRIQPFDPDKASPMQASFYAECRRVSNARAKAALGWRPSYPSWREGLQAIWDQR